MDTRHRVTLPSVYINQSIEQGKLIVASYAAGMNPSSRAVSYRGAEGNEELQAEAKMAECAFCVWAGLEPFRELHWSAKTDAGYDVCYNGYRLDIKWSWPKSRYLIWSKAKNHIFESKKFDGLVLVLGKRPIFEMCGWLTKPSFHRLKEIATASHALDEGTWFVERADLWNMESL